MKKVTETITLNSGKRKEVTLKLDEQIYEALMRTGDRTLYEAYLAEEYNTLSLNRRMKDNCTSLDTILDEGHDFADKTVDILRDFLCSEEKELVIKFLRKHLTKRETEVVTLYILDDMIMVEVAEKLGISAARVCQLFHAAEKKLQEILPNP